MVCFAGKTGRRPQLAAFALSRSAASSQVCECSGVNDQVCECSRVNERIYRPVAIRSDAELTLLKMAFMRAS